MPLATHVSALQWLREKYCTFLSYYETKHREDWMWLGRKHFWQSKLAGPHLFANACSSGLHCMSSDYSPLSDAHK